MDGALPLSPWVNAGGGEDDGAKDKNKTLVGRMDANGGFVF